MHQVQIRLQWLRLAVVIKQLVQLLGVQFHLLLQLLMVEQKGLKLIIDRNKCLDTETLLMKLLLLEVTVAQFPWLVKVVYCKGCGTIEITRRVELASKCKRCGGMQMTRRVELASKFKGCVGMQMTRRVKLTIKVSLCFQVGLCPHSLEMCQTG